MVQIATLPQTEKDLHGLLRGDQEHIGWEQLKLDHNNLDPAGYAKLDHAIKHGDLTPDEDHFKSGGKSTERFKGLTERKKMLDERITSKRAKDPKANVSHDEGELKKVNKTIEKHAKEMAGDIEKNLKLREDARKAIEGAHEKRIKWIDKQVEAEMKLLEGRKASGALSEPEFHRHVDNLEKNKEAMVQRVEEIRTERLTELNEKMSGIETAATALEKEHGVKLLKGANGKGAVGNLLGEATYGEKVSANLKHGGFTGKMKVAVGSIVGAGLAYDGVRRIAQSGSVDPETQETKGGLWVGVGELGVAASSLIWGITHGGKALHLQHGK